MRRIALGLSALVALGVIVGVAIETLREKTVDPSLPRPTMPVVLAPRDIGEFGEQLKDAAESFNKAVGCPLVSIDSENGWLSVRMMTTEAIPAGKDASYFPGHKAIVVRQFTDTDQAYGVLYHEIGHIFRLAHDDVGGSIMNSPPQYSLVPKPSLTPKDIAWIRKEYGCAKN